MAIQQGNSLIHWNYFLTIEEDLLRLNRFVDFSEANHKTHSIEIARILMLSSAEIDVILKQLCKKIKPEVNASSISKYEKIISEKAPLFKTFKVTMPSYAITLEPWVSWQQESSPFWWKANNKVKHHRNTNFQDANLKNCLNSVAALYITNLFFYKEEAVNGNLLNLPKLFNVTDANFGGNNLGRYGQNFKYKFES